MGRTRSSPTSTRSAACPATVTTPIVVAIVARLGSMPKTSSRAITSPAGTADTMESSRPSRSTSRAMRRVVEREGGCIVWGGRSASVPPTISSSRSSAPSSSTPRDSSCVVLSKKAAAGATHVVVDIPVGPTAKVRTAEAAATVGEHLVAWAPRWPRVRRDHRRLAAGGPRHRPGARGARRARRRCEATATRRATCASARAVAAAVLELRSAVPRAAAVASHVRDPRPTVARGGSSRRSARRRGACVTPPVATSARSVSARTAGCRHRDRQRPSARAAKLAGAPAAPSAGVELHVRVGDAVEAASRCSRCTPETPVTWRTPWTTWPPIATSCTSLEASGDAAGHGPSGQRGPCRTPRRRCSAARWGADLAARFPMARRTCGSIRSAPDRRSCFSARSIGRMRGVLRLLFLAGGLRELGATRVGLVAPYLAVSAPGLPVSARRRYHVAELRPARVAERRLARDGRSAPPPLSVARRHLHDSNDIVHAAPVLAAWIGTRDRPVIVGPDDESEQWVNGIARHVGAPLVILEKIRRGDRDVEISLPSVDSGTVTRRSSSTTSCRRRVR